MGRSSVNPNNYDEDETGGNKPMRVGTENNQSANDRFYDACKAAGLTDGQGQILHKQVKNTKYTYQELYEMALEVKRNWSNK